MPSLLPCYRLLIRTRTPAVLLERLCEELVASCGADFAWVGMNVPSQPGRFRSAGVAGEPVWSGTPDRWPPPGPLTQAASAALVGGAPQTAHIEGRYTLVLALDNGLERVGVWMVGLQVEPTTTRIGELRDLARDAAMLYTRLHSRAPTRKAWRTLRESEARMRTLFTEAPIGMALVAADLHIVTANRALSRALGRREDSLPGTPYVDLVHPDERAAITADLGRLFQEGVAPPRRECRHLSATGGVAWGQLTAAMITARGASLRFAVLMIEDTTQLRRVQLDLVRTQKMEAVGRFAGGIAHEFNNLLTAVVCAAEAGMEELSDGHPILGDLQVILEASGRAAALTQRLMTFSHHHLPHPQLLDLNEIVTHAQETLSNLIGDEVRVQVETTARLPRFRGDEALLRQVMTNLVANARDAMPEGGTLTLRTGHTLHAPDPSTPARDMLVLTVQDTGCGIEEDALARIFDPFFTTKGRPGSGGLGLSTTYGIVSQIGGHIRVESQPGAGTTFRVYLPIEREQPTSPGSEPQPRPKPPEQIRVLLVEDEELVRNHLRRTLKRRGYDVVVAPDGPTAITHLASAERPFQLMLTDIVMPGMSGWELIEEVARRAPEVRPIAMSGFTEGNDGTASRAEVPFIQKPFRPRELLRLLREVMERD